MALSFELARAYVTLSAQGGVKNALDEAQARVAAYAKANRAALAQPATPAAGQVGALPGGGKGAAPGAQGLEAAAAALGVVGARMDVLGAKSRVLQPLVEYARASGLQLRGTREEADRLAAALARVKTPEGFDSWLRGQKNLQEMTAAVVKFQATAQTAFSQGRSMLERLVQAASPAHWDTLQGSISLVATALGEAFLPFVEMAVDWLQDLAFWIKGLDPETKKNIATWIMWGGAVLGAVVVGSKIVGIIQGVMSLLGPVASAVRLAGSAFSLLGPAIGRAGSALSAFMMAHPIAFFVGIAAAVAGVIAAFSGANSELAELAGRLDNLRETEERLRGGGQVTRADVRRLAPEVQERLNAAGGNQERQQAVLRAEEARLSAQATQREARERDALRAAAALTAVQDTSSPEYQRTASSLRNRSANRRVYLEQRLGRQLNERERSAFDEIFPRGGLAGLGSGESRISEEAINRFANSIRAQGQNPATQLEIVRAALRQGLPQETQGQGQRQRDRQRLVNVNFRAEMGGIESAIRRVQLAALGGNTLEAQQRQWQLDQLTRLTEIRDRLPNPQNPAPNPPPPNVGGEF